MNLFSTSVFPPSVIGGGYRQLIPQSGPDTDAWRSRSFESIIDSPERLMPIMAANLACPLSVELAGSHLDPLAEVLVKVGELVQLDANRAPSLSRYDMWSWLKSLSCRSRHPPRPRALERPAWSSASSAAWSPPASTCYEWAARGRRPRTHCASCRARPTRCWRTSPSVCGRRRRGEARTWPWSSHFRRCHRGRRRPAGVWQRSRRPVQNPR